MPRRINTPQDVVRGGEQAIYEASLLNFWRWAYGDLCDDEIKGIFAEWLVYKLLGVASPRRIGWANSDVVTSIGVRIEVKAASYWQSWKLIDGNGLPHAKPLYAIPPDSKIRFAGLTARDGANVADRSTPRTLKSQMYVFAFQHEKKIDHWDAMDLSQWEFYVVRAEELGQFGGRTVPLTKLRPKYGPLSATEFVSRANHLIERLARESNAS